MSVDKNDFDEQLELAAIREMRKHDDHGPIQEIVLGVLLLVISICVAVMSS